MQVCGLASAMMLASMAEREQTRGIYAAKVPLFRVKSGKFSKKLLKFCYFLLFRQRLPTLKMR